MSNLEKELRKYTIDNFLSLIYQNNQLDELITIPEAF